MSLGATSEIRPGSVSRSQMTEASRASHVGSIGKSQTPAGSHERREGLLIGSVGRTEFGKVLPIRLVTPKPFPGKLCRRESIYEGVSL